MIVAYKDQGASHPLTEKQQSPQPDYPPKLALPRGLGQSRLLSKRTRRADSGERRNAGPNTEDDLCIAQVLPRNTERSLS